MAVEGGFDLGDECRRGVEGVALAGGRAVEPVELEAEAGVALGEVVEEDREAGCRRRARSTAISVLASLLRV